MIPLSWCTVHWHRDWRRTHRCRTGSVIRSSPGGRHTCSHLWSRGRSHTRPGRIGDPHSGHGRRSEGLEYKIIQDDYVNWWGANARPQRLLLHRDHGYEIEWIFLSDHGWQDQDDTEILHPSEMTRKWNRLRIKQKHIQNSVKIRET